MACRLLSSVIAATVLVSPNTVATAQQTVQGDGPTIQHFVAPEYPAAAWLAKVEGNAIAEVTIKSDGSVDLVRVVSGPPIFQRSLEVALKKWTFRVPSAATIKITAEFKLDKNCSWTPSTAAGRDSRSRIETQVAADLPSKVKISTCPPVIETSVDHAQNK
jgi:TonB family protein